MYILQLWVHVCTHCRFCFTFNLLYYEIIQEVAVFPYSRDYHWRESGIIIIPISMFEYLRGPEFVSDMLDIKTKNMFYFQHTGPTFPRFYADDVTILGNSDIIHNQYSQRSCGSEFLGPSVSPIKMVMWPMRRVQIPTPGVQNSSGIWWYCQRSRITCFNGPKSGWSGVHTGMLSLSQTIAHTLKIITVHIIHGFLCLNAQLKWLDGKKTEVPAQSGTMGKHMQWGKRRWFSPWCFSRPEHYPAHLLLNWLINMAKEN